MEIDISLAKPAAIASVHNLYGQEDCGAIASHHDNSPVPQALYIPRLPPRYSAVPLLPMLLHDCAGQLLAENVLFADAFLTNRYCPAEGILGTKQSAEELPMRSKANRMVIGFVEANGGAVATGS